jgi:SAM-dependent methyltransferase
VKEGFYREYFELEDRHWWFVGRRTIFLSLLDAHLPAIPSARTRDILDVGCGTGTMVRHLGRYGEARGADTSGEAIRFCRERGIDSVVQTSGTTLPYDEDSFDLVTALDVIEHIDDDRGTLTDLRRILRPGGHLLVSVPAYEFLWGPQDEVSEHKRRYTLKELGRRLDEAGFHTRRLTYFNTLLFPPIAAIRLLRPHRPGRSEPKSDFRFTVPRWACRTLAAIFGMEAALLRRVDLPFGVSILALAVKPDPAPPLPPSLA